MRVVVLKKGGKALYNKSSNCIFKKRQVIKTEIYLLPINIGHNGTCTRNCYKARILQQCLYNQVLFEMLAEVQDFYGTSHSWVLMVTISPAGHFLSLKGGHQVDGFSILSEKN